MVHNLQNFNPAIAHTSRIMLINGIGFHTHRAYVALYFFLLFRTGQQFKAKNNRKVLLIQQTIQSVVALPASVQEVHLWTKSGLEFRF